MGDSDQADKKTDAPSWQVKPKEEAAEPVEQPTPEEHNREAVIEQAKKFLEEEEVRNASTDKKIAFLESKGLTNGEIQDLLGVTRNSEASSTSELPPSTQTSLQAPIQPPPPQNQHLQQMPSQPPIITYPEFLTTPQSPTPLVTKQRLLTTLYLFSGLSAILYGTDAYLIKPMLASLTDSRLSFSQTASSNMQRLISQLEGMVSEIPALPTNNHTSHHNEEGDEEESDEDPTEMFHRDIGVQTSFSNTPSASRPGSPSPVNSSSILANQTARLTSLKSSLEELLQDNRSSEGLDAVDLEIPVTNLREYLDGLAYVTPSYGFSGGYNYGNGNELDDEIAKVKAGIRGVKGVLLSARSFPAGVSGVTNRYGK